MTGFGGGTTAFDSAGMVGFAGAAAATGFLAGASAITFSQIDEALRDFVLQDTAHLRRATENVTRGNLRPESAPEVVASVNSLVQQVAGVSLDQLDYVIVELRHLRDYLHSEGERVQREISGFLRLNQVAIGSTKIISDNITLWKEGAHGALESEPAIAAPLLPAPP
jgi:hypothetical protein